LKKLKRKIAARVLLTIVLLIVVGPHLARLPPLRHWCLRAALPKIEGEVYTGGASFGWFSPVEYRDITISARDGAPAITIPAIRGERLLWRCALSPREWGAYVVERPVMYAARTERGLSILEVFPDLSTAPRAAVSTTVRDGTLIFTGQDGAERWRIERVNFAFEMDISPLAEGREIQCIVRPGLVCDHTPITPKMCEDLLKFIAPALAGATKVQGEFSLELDEWHLPSDSILEGRGAGRLRLHTIDVAPGPIIRHIAETLGLQPSLRLADNTVVSFELKQGRIYHRDLAIGLRNFEIRTRGSVGADQSLDLEAEFRLAPGSFDSSPLALLLQGKTLTMPIRGTVSQPQFDWQALGLGSAGPLLRSLPRLFSEPPPKSP
jgi:hypothetical protein